jgi:hypothetical protein
MAAPATNALGPEDRCDCHLSNGLFVSDIFPSQRVDPILTSGLSVGVVSCIRLSSLYILQTSPDLTCNDRTFLQTEGNR